MTLGQLLTGLDVLDFCGTEAQPISSIHYDSRTVRPGGLFVAIHGLRADGNEYVDDAISRGAAGIITENGGLIKRGVSIAHVENIRQALAAVSSTFYGNPSQGLIVIGITGTNGKTTTSYLVEAMLRAAGHQVGVIGTINYRFGAMAFPNPVTTPESTDLMRILRQMADAGVTHVVAEVSSHALALNRVATCEFDVGVFTNLTQDHLDFHKDMDEYWLCKRKLFVEGLKNKAKSANKAAAVINVDDPRGRQLLRELSVPCIRIGLGDDSEISVEKLSETAQGTSGLIKVKAPHLAAPSGPAQGSFEFRSHLVGQHNIYNILTAAGVAIALGVPLEAVKRGIEFLRGIPGRLERVENWKDFSVFVDYAHTPDALENVLKALRRLTAGRLITVFGCGGDRDAEKRPLMGAVAGRLSDLSIITSDNPRSEDPAAILSSVSAGVRSAAPKRYSANDILQNGFQEPGYVEEIDRRRAIEIALRSARRDDMVLIAGKGHESYQIIGNRTIAFDDRAEALEILAGISHAPVPNPSIAANQLG